MGRARLLRWYRGHRRDLPWRRTRDPYAIWVAEIMLQQTRVETVVPFYGRFLERFPDAHALAEASEEEVLGQWAGLGYYRRARSLHAGARQLVAESDGELPDDPQALQRLPGIGRYTAGAIASIAFGRQAPILDGNVRRVLARIHAIDGSCLGTAEETRRLWAAATEWVRGPAPGELNQGLMELGAVVCSPREPDCRRCPVARDCRARNEDRLHELPSAGPGAAISTVSAVVAWVQRGARVLLERPSEVDSPLRGEWDLPAAIHTEDQTAEAAASAALSARYGLGIEARGSLGSSSHAIMNRRFRLTFLACVHRSGRTAAHSGLRWIDRERIEGAAVSGATLKALRSALRTATAGPAARDPGRPRR